MAGQAASNWRAIAIWILRFVLGAAFLALGAAKILGIWHMVDFFAAIGWGQWFRYLTGVLDLMGAVLLFVPKWTCYGSLVLACSVGLATAISFFLLHNPVAVPLTLTLLAALLAWLTRPHRVN
jgi:uncharacterized membrane protein YphA (DoxX/SURF4 family)